MVHHPYHYEYEPPVETYPRHRGCLELITGSMFSGKTEELIRRCRREMHAERRVRVYKPVSDTRFHPNRVVAHEGEYLVAGPIPDEKPEQILIGLPREVQVIGIDEAQFFARTLVQVCTQLADEGRRVIVAGLALDSRGKSFETVHDLFPEADDIMVCKAVCFLCHEERATRSKRLSPSPERVKIGDDYQARCRACFTVDRKE